MSQEDISNVKKGEDFEIEAGEIIKSLFDNNEISLNINLCEITKKPNYYSGNRRTKIEFDWSIKCTPKGAKNPEITYIIECKNYTKKLPSSELEASITQVNQLYLSTESEYKLQVKLVYILQGEYAQSSIDVAETNGIKLIQVFPNKEYKILHHKTQKEKKSNSQVIIVGGKWQNNLKKALLSYVTQTNLATFKLQGLKKLNKKNIRKIAKNEFSKINKPILLLNDLIIYLKLHHRIILKYKKLKLNNNQKILGYYDKNKCEIILNKDIKNTKQELFCLCHEIGHAVLHKEVFIDSFDYFSYDQSEGSTYDNNLNTWKINDDKGFLENQANTFAAEFLINNQIFILLITQIQKYIGISSSKTGYIFKDTQPCNIRDYFEIVNMLSDFLNVTVTIIEIRLRELKIIRS